MSPRLLPLVLLSELVDGQEADVFALLSAKSEATTRDGKPYWRISFRDASREVSFPIWSDSAFSDTCRQWQVGQCYKLRTIYCETKFGPQLDIKKIRLVTTEDKADGFDAWSFLPRSKFDS